MTDRVLKDISGRLSLRAPQADSLQCLEKMLAVAPGMLSRQRDPAEVLALLREHFPKLEDFERNFPSLCFALATGVGKTRLMGAFIAYLHLAHGINNFFVLAPNLTVYNKLIADFSRNTPKYVFRGIAQFAQQPPLIITGENYEQSGARAGGALAQDVRINIFNISKINSEVRGGSEPRIKRMREVLGESYFDYLTALPDLVLLMDESHRYRASAGIRSINELRPLFGLELTATPFVEAGAGKTVPFRNVVLDYPLGRAIEDGFVKEPAVVTQRNFDANLHSAETIERIKLEDGMRLHEATRAELATYARENNTRLVKPLVLVIARDTAHAGQLLGLLESAEFHEGRYRGKVIQIDSSRTGAREDEMVSRLLAVESVDEPTEIVIHVNMLKEGWDVTNLYTIIPLRAAKARTLIEQSIGRGLRLPYGKRTGVAAVDRLNIVAHDRFQEIVDDANRPDSPVRLRQYIIEPPAATDAKVSVQVQPELRRQLELGTGAEDGGGDGKPLFTSEIEREAARIVLDVIGTYETRGDVAPTIVALLQPELRQEILDEVRKRLAPDQFELFGQQDGGGVQLDLDAVVARTTETVVRQSIDIPRIHVVPSDDIRTGFHPFQLDFARLHLQPASREIVGQTLRTNQQFTLHSVAEDDSGRPEDTIVRALCEYDDIDYSTHADLLYELAGQLVGHLSSYLSEAEVRNVLQTEGHRAASEIHTQMLAQFWEEASDYRAVVSRGFTELKPYNYTAVAGELVRKVRDTLPDPENIKSMTFGHFTHCLYPVQKFDSDTERRFAVILERDADKWLKPVKGQVQIFYRLGGRHAEYVPDFIAESADVIYMAETKARHDLDSPEVKAKAAAAAVWCKNATEHAARFGAKPWVYLLIPHDEVTESKKLGDYLRFQINVDSVQY